MLDVTPAPAVISDDTEIEFQAENGVKTEIKLIVNEVRLRNVGKLLSNH